MTTQDRFDMTSDLYKKPDGPVAPAVQEQLEKGNKLLVGCIRCMESTVVATSEELEVWFDVEFIVASVDDREVALKGFDAWMATLARLAGIERAET
jgi:hypothetical protein